MKTLRCFAVAAVTLASALAIVGCATIVTGGQQKVSVGSTPQGAKFTVLDMSGNEVSSGQTPCAVKLKRGKGFFKQAEYKVVIERDGYQKAEVALTSGMNGWYVGNFLIGELLGFLIIDPTTGAMWSLEPASVEQALEQQTVSSLFHREEGVAILLEEDVPADLRPLMVSMVL